MIYALLLLASLANAQEVSTGAATSLLDEVRISNLGKDTRDLLSGRYRQTGKPTFANGFCFADGTCQTTAAVGAGGPEVFTSTLTIGNQVINSTANYSAALVGGWSIVASTDICGVSVVDFTNLYSSVSYRYDITILQSGSASVPNFKVNGDGGANYGYGNWGDRYASGADNAQTDGTTSARLIGGNSVAAGATASFTGTFRTVRGDGTYVRGNGTMNYISGGSGSGGFTSFNYDGASELSSVQFNASAGTFCISAIIEALIISGVPGSF